MASKKQLYNLDSIIQKNDLTISYCSIDPKTNKEFFIKGINPGVGSFTDIFKKEFLTKSYKLSQKIRSDLILTPLKLINTKNEFLIIYPYLDPEIWQPLNENIIKTNYKYFLRQICLIIDHLHECNLVHCDIKLSNFMYDKNANRIILIDLDFISENQSKCNAIVKGTAEYIAPDIIKNNIIDKTADYYAFAVSLEKIYADSKIPKELLLFTEDIKKDVNQKSISSLLNLLRKHNLIDNDSSERYKQVLFALYILQVKHNLSKYSKQSKRNNFLKKLFSVKNKIVGFDEEVLDLLNTISLKSKRAAFKQLRSLILNSKLEKMGEYWICYIPEDRLMSIVSQVYCEYTYEEKVIEIKKLQAELKFFTVYLLIKHTTGKENNSESLENKFLLKSLAESCIALNKTEEALSTYERFLPLETSDNKMSIIYEITTLNLALNKEEIALDYIKKHLKDSDKKTQLKFKTLQIYIDIRKGNYTKAEDSLNYIIDQSKKYKIHFTEISGYYYLSLLFYYQGVHSKAIFYAEKCIEKAKYYKSKDQLITVQTAAVLYCSLSGAYQNAIQYGMKALNNIDFYHSYSKKVNILNHLFICFLRTGNYTKAKEVLINSISSDNLQKDENKLILFFLNKGSIELYEGDLQNAKSSFLIVTNFENNDFKNNLGSAYQNLVQISLYTNNQKDFKFYYEKAKSYFDFYNDTSSQLQLKFFDLTNKLHNTETAIETNSLFQIYVGLRELNEGYSSSIVLLQYLLNCITCQSEPEYKRISSMKLENSKNPFIRCISTLLELKDNESTIAIINCLKVAYKEMSKNNFTYFAAIIATIIAQQYEAIENYKLSIKFYEQANELYRSIDNLINSKRINLKLSKLMKVIEEKPNSNSSLVRELSYILQNIENYEVCIKRSLQFILDQTGAERAVLLLKKEHSSELRVKAYINCDEESLTDIYEFSSSITLQSFQQQSSIIIENALEDNRSNQFQSIIAHNIQSIISIPIKKDNKMLGVLYLDHQTIPALFTQTDIEFANLLANLLAIILHTLDSFRNISIINQELVAELESKTSHSKFVSNNKNINKIFDKLPNIAKTNATILLLGESGTGKEVFADIIHKLSLRANKPFIKVNCTAFAENLIESELFGIDKNVATDVKTRDGKFSVADTGTLFIDEIGDMPLNIQSKILRAIEYQKFEKVGSNRTIRTDIRFIYATNKDLLQLVKEGKFREDLYHRINIIPINIPPLRDRKDDLSLLIEHFIKMYKLNNNPPVLSAEVLSFFNHYNWPGNVRELKNIIERLCIMYQGEIVNISHLPKDLISSIEGMPIDSIKEIAEKHHIIEALRLHNNIESRAAKSIRMPLSTFRRKIIKYNIRK